MKTAVQQTLQCINSITSTLPRRSTVLYRLQIVNTPSNTTRDHGTWSETWEIIKSTLYARILPEKTSEIRQWFSRKGHSCRQYKDQPESNGEAMESVRAPYSWQKPSLSNRSLDIVTISGKILTNLLKNALQKSLRISFIGSWTTPRSKREVPLRLIGSFSTFSIQSRRADRWTSSQLKRFRQYAGGRYELIEHNTD